jgi:hypothetical protein
MINQQKQLHLHFFQIFPREIINLPPKNSKNFNNFIVGIKDWINRHQIQLNNQISQKTKN